MKRSYIKNTHQHDPKVRHHLHTLTKTGDIGNAHLEKIKDTIVEINNNEIGDASDGLRCFVYGHDEPNGKARALFLDSSHNLKVKDDDILTEATTSNTKLDTVNTNLTNLKNAQEVGTMDANNTRNIGDGSSVQTRMCMGYDNDNGKVRSIDVDSDGRININVVSNVAASGVSTEAKQDDIESSLNSIETLLTTQATHNTNLFIRTTEIDTAVDLVNTNLTTIDGVLDNIKTAHDTHNLGVASSHTALLTNSTFTASTYSTAIDLLVSGSNELYRDLTIYGKFTNSTSPSFHFAFSSDDVSYYIDPSYTATVDDGTNKHFVMSAENVPFRYVKVYNTSTAAANNCYLNWVALKHR